MNEVIGAEVWSHNSSERLSGYTTQLSFWRKIRWFQFPLLLRNSIFWHSKYAGCTRAVWKVSDLWQEKIYYLGDGIGTLIPFKVGSLRLHTISPPMLPLPKTLLEGFFWNGVISAVAFCIISSLLSKRDPFNVVFNFGNNQKSQGADRKSVV